MYFIWTVVPNKDFKPQVQVSSLYTKLNYNLISPSCHPSALHAPCYSHILNIKLLFTKQEKVSAQASLTSHLSSDIRHYSYWPSMTTNISNPSNPAYIRILQPCCHAHYHPQKESSGSSSRSYHPYINKQCALSLQADTVKEYKGCQIPALHGGSGKNEPNFICTYFHRNTLQYHKNIVKSAQT